MDELYKMGGVLLSIDPFKALAYDKKKLQRVGAAPFLRYSPLHPPGFSTVQRNWMRYIPFIVYNLCAPSRIAGSSSAYPIFPLSFFIDAFISLPRIIVKNLFHFCDTTSMVISPFL
jgi:hypothetical protein